MRKDARSQIALFSICMTAAFIFGVVIFVVVSWLLTKNANTKKKRKSKTRKETYLWSLLLRGHVSNLFDANM